MAGLSGLAGMMGGYQEAEGTDAQNRIRRAQAIEAQNDQMGQDAFGRALQLMFGGGGVVQAPGAPGANPQPPQGDGMPPRPPMDVGGGPAPAGRPSPMPPAATGPAQSFYGDATLGSSPPTGPGGQQMPGVMNPQPMASQPQLNMQPRQPMAGTPQRPDIPPQPPSMLSPQRMSPAGPGGGNLPPASSMGANGQAPGGMQAGPQGPTGGRQGPLTLENVIAAVTRANPGAPPGVIAAAVNRFLPMMNAQSQMQWREFSLMMREQQVQQAWQRLSQTDRRLDQADERQADLGNYRNAKLKQGEQAEARRERTSEANTQIRRDALTERQGQNQRTNEFRQGREDRVAKQAEERLKQSAERLNIAKEKLKLEEMRTLMKKDEQMKRAEKQLNEGRSKGDIAMMRLAIDAAHKRATEIIQSWWVVNKLDPKLLQDARQLNDSLYKRIMQEAMGGGQGGGSGQGSPAAPKFNPDSGKIE